MENRDMLLLSLIMGKNMQPQAGYYRRKDCADRYVVYLNMDGKRYKRQHYDDRFQLVHEELAKDLCRQINADIEAKRDQFDPGRWFDAARGKVKRFPQYLSDWLARQRLGHSYAPGVHRAIKHAQDWDGWRDLTIQEIRGGHLQDWLDQLPEHLAPKTRKNILAVIHRVFTEARDQREEIDRIPVWPKVGVPEYEPQHLTREWQERILAEIPEIDRPIFAFMALYGCRPGEARALMWDCVDEDLRTITLRRTFSWTTLKEATKTSRIRTLPWMPGTEDILARARARRGPVVDLRGKNWVFLNSQGRHYSDEVSRTWNAARDRSGCPQRVPLYEGIRHSWGTQAVEAGIPLEVIRAWLGHTGDAMTRRYARVTGKALELATRRGT